ncbi:hypothetical protein SEA_OBLADI_114 [Gordonia phage ObLaDi]|uniref:Uncharacterized protein n=2 Tax=Cafassovirus TaxID=3425056 RepID=A0AAE7VE16_9CAUD|nr:hypothetical protein SEA_CAFASSO_115 [Gordonia phage Cafasso]UXE03837.1 hypothetical protein SEA_OBLADI_114 [Gordonia phage ObLaDi]
MAKAKRLSKGAKQRSLTTGRFLSNSTTKRHPDGREPRREESTIAIGHPDVGSLTPEQRRAYIELIGTNVAEWSADLNRRLA